MQRIASAVLCDLEITALEQVGRALLRIEVELVEQHHVGAHALQHRRDPARLGVAAFEPPDQSAGCRVVQ